jgi:CTP synthase
MDQKKQKLIFVTGGVVSGIGKGILAASIGLILKSSGIDTTALKIDPYLNVDPGTMSPYEHGEVYVLNDGSETDLDLGHYERFLDTDLSKESTLTAGKIFSSIIEKERRGDYLGKTVQMIPTVTDFIQNNFEIKNGETAKIIEIGGSTGDIEAELFLESLKQYKAKNKNNTLHLHVGYVPFLKSCGEFKTKPMQNSLRELHRAGLQPDVVILRSESDENTFIDEAIIKKLAIFSNLPEQNIISLPDQNSIYSVPEYLIKNTQILNTLSTFIGKTLKPQLNSFYLSPTKKFDSTKKIGLIAKYTKLKDSYFSIIESLKIAAHFNNVNVQIDILESEDEKILNTLNDYDAFVIPGGFGVRGMEGKISCIEWIRKNKRPCLGICLGLQLSVVEFARNVLNVPNAVSAEMLNKEENSDKYEIIVDFLTNQKDIEKLGGTMRLGSYKCEIEDQTIAKDLYKKDTIIERHRHRLEVQNKYIAQLEQNGMKISGKHYFDPDNKENFLIEIIELNKVIHPFFVAIQSHPEFLSRPGNPHPLFSGLIQATINKT